MKKIILLLLLTLLPFSVVVQAEEVVEGDTTEEVFQEVEYTYKIQETGEKGTITLISATECEVSDESGVFLRTTYTIEGDLLIIDKSNEQIHFRINDTFELEFIGFFELPSDFKEVVYTLNDGEDIVTITLISPTECTIVIYHEDATATVNGKYVIEGDVLTLYIAGELFSDFTIMEDGTLEFVDEYIPEEPEPIEPEDVPVEFRDQIKDFIDKWFTPIVSALTGLFGALSVLFACKKKVNSLTDSLNKIKTDSEELRKGDLSTLESVKKSLEEEKKKLSKEYEEAIKELEGAKKELYNQVLVTKELLQQSINDKNTISMLKDLLVLAVSSNPAFATSEAGQKMLDLLNEKKGE